MLESSLEPISKIGMTSSSKIRDFKKYSQLPPSSIMLTDKNPDINKALSLQHPQFEKERRIFKNKLNKFFTHPLVADLLDQEVLDYLV